VLAVDPWAVLSTGFWLSFGAVAAIFYALACRAGSPGRLQAAFAEQAAVTVVMLPLAIALFQEVSLVSPLANCVRDPVVSWIVVPLAIAGAFLDAAPALDAAPLVMEALMQPLAALARGRTRCSRAMRPQPGRSPRRSAGCAWLPRTARGAAALARASSGWCRSSRSRPRGRLPGEAWIDVLDVGNGLRSSCAPAHALVYDAGPTWSDDADGGERIVVPFLRGEGIGAWTAGDLARRRRPLRRGDLGRRDARADVAALVAPARGRDPRARAALDALRCGQSGRGTASSSGVLHPHRRRPARSARPGPSKSTT
jgi:competence protein ComEC